MPRKLDAQQLHEKALQHGLQGSVYPHPKDALGVAKSQANEEDLILIMGSFFVVSEIL